MRTKASFKSSAWSSKPSSIKETKTDTRIPNSCGILGVRRWPDAIVLWTMDRASSADPQLPEMSHYVTEQPGVERALRAHVKFVVQEKSLKKPLFWQVKFLQTGMLYVT